MGSFTLLSLARCLTQNSGEASDHIQQTEVDELDIGTLLPTSARNEILLTTNEALKNAEAQSNQPSQRGLQNFVGLVAQLPVVGSGFADEARDLQTQSQQQDQENQRMRASGGIGPSSYTVPGLTGDLDPVKVAGQIYPILVWRDRLVKV